MGNVKEHQKAPRKAQLLGQIRDVRVALARQVNLKELYLKKYDEQFAGANATKERLRAALSILRLAREPR